MAGPGISEPPERRGSRPLAGKGSGSVEGKVLRHGRAAFRGHGNGETVGDEIEYRARRPVESLTRL